LSAVALAKADRKSSGTALIETAIVLPLYMILLWGLIYFGFATLGRQRQDKATAYSAWQSSQPMVADLLSAYWGSAAPPYTSFSAGGGSEYGQITREGDEYYGMQRNLSLQGSQWLWPGQENYSVQYDQSDDITGTVATFVPYQLDSFHEVSNGGYGAFDTERVTVDLWNFALGSVTQSFNFLPGQGIQQQMNVNYTDFGNYLNTASPQNSQTGGGLINVPTPIWNPITQTWMNPSPGPTPQLASTEGQWPEDCGGVLASVLGGTSGNSSWIERQAVESTMNYNPPFLSAFWGDQGASQNTSFSEYATLSYPPPVNPPTSSTMDCDVTFRNPLVVRQGAEEGSQSPAAFLSVVGQLFGESGGLPPPNSLDNMPLNANGTTMMQAWTPW
jgi:hypothetical protein